MTSHPRGTALPTAMIAAVIIAVVAVGIIRFASRGSLGASAAVNEQALVACAEDARLRLLSQFHVLGLEPTRIQALNVPLGSASSSAAGAALGGHYDQGSYVTGAVIDQVTYLPATASGPTSTARNLTGISSLVGQGGRPMKVVVHCQMASGRQLEVEFGIKFGM